MNLLTSGKGPTDNINDSIGKTVYYYCLNNKKYT